MWGPIAGYYATRGGDKLTVVPLTKDVDKAGRLDFRITMGVRQGDDLWKRQLNDVIRKRQADIDKVLLEYGVPMIDEDSKPITTPAQLKLASSAPADSRVRICGGGACAQRLCAPPACCWRAAALIALPLRMPRTAPRPGAAASAHAQSGRAPRRRAGTRCRRAAVRARRRAHRPTAWRTSARPVPATLRAPGCCRRMRPPISGTRTAPSSSTSIRRRPSRRTCPPAPSGANRRIAASRARSGCQMSATARCRPPWTNTSARGSRRCRRASATQPSSSSASRTAGCRGTRPSGRWSTAIRNVMWFRDGTDGWQELGYPLVEVKKLP